MAEITGRRSTRRRPAGEEPAPEAAEPAAELVTGAPPAAPAPAAPTPPRRALDLDALREVAEMSPEALRAALEEFAPRRATARLRRGQRVSGAITRLTPDTAFVDVGEKADASIDRAELPASAAAGQQLDAYVLSTTDGEVRLTLSLGGDATREMLEEAREHRMPVQGKVTAATDHGLDVALSGGVRAFCPASHADAPGGTADLEDFVGRSLVFHVIDVRGREAVVSRRAIAEEEAREEHARSFASVREGETYDGVVTGVREFGAFVRILPGVEGLVHLSNLASTRVARAEDVVKEGQPVRVRVLSIESAKKRINLGMRQAVESVTAEPGAPGRVAEPGFGLLGSLLQGVRIEPKKKR